MQPETLVSFEMAFLQFQSWNFAGMDNYLQDKLGATKIKVQQKKKKKQWYLSRRLHLPKL